MPNLEERYTDTEGSFVLTGVQSLVRLMLDQQRRDRAEGLHTAALVSGYEGSPLGGLDLELARRRQLLDDLDIVHQPGLNEELAATAIAGSQLAPTRPDSSFAGVVGWWYGKAPGLDRATDAFRHANLTGAHPRGGAVALVGDDPLSKSSTVPSASEQALAELGLPTFYPADSREVLELGLHAVAMSRASGLWTAMKMVTNVADGAGDTPVGLDRLRIVTPELPGDDGSPFRHVPDAKLITPFPVEAERTAFGIRMDVAREYARRNDVNPVEAHGSHDRIGIVAPGKSYLDVCQALDRLGLDTAARERHGIRLLKLGLVFPLEPTLVYRFAEGLDQIIVVEEKRSFIETAFKEQLYGRAEAPEIVGKRDRHGAPLLRSDGELDPDAIAEPLARFLATGGVDQAQAWLERPAPREAAALLPIVSASGGAVTAKRTPYFCSGCPHNRSTRAPEGSLVGGGIGCHGMVLLMDPEQVGEVMGVTQMGGEGAHWLGMAPFVETEHLLQNIGDGTFHHSGSLALRAAVASGANITYKLLYNSAVAMTGGQEAVGVRTVPELVELLHAEGVQRTIVTTEDPKRYRGRSLAGGAEVWHRDRLEEAQRELAAVPGVTALIHDQQCAAEKRRARKRHPPAKPETRVFINERVCEGCGDCGVKSNCLSVEPVETDYGRKTQIHQGSCNTDYSCLEGDCPSFLTVVPPKRPAKRKSGGGAADTPGTRMPLPKPSPRLRGEEEATIRITGIGGTGVVTVAQVIAQAAQLAGLHVRTLDQTGLSQKAGPVVSDLKLSRSPIAGANKLAAGECDLYLGCDVLVAAEAKNLVAADPQRTVAVVSTGRVPTGRMVADPSQEFPDLDAVTAPILAATRDDAGVHLDARRLAEGTFGSDQLANVVTLGAAFQAGALPLPSEAIEEAIKMNGVAVEQNLSAFSLGRRAAVDPDLEVAPAPRQGARARKHEEAGRQIAALVETEAGSELERLVSDRAADLVAYQSARYARTYTELVERVRSKEGQETPGQSALAEAVAHNLHKLMAYKDEYEVARLSLDPALRERIEAQFGPGARYSYRLHPPALRALGLKRKIALGRWSKPLFATLRAGRRLRGTPLDLFGIAEVRRVERRLIAEYRGLVETLIGSLSPANHGIAVELAGLPDMVRGYEHIKLGNVERYEMRQGELRAAFEAKSHADDRRGSDS